MTVVNYTGWEYLAIDVANNFNLDLDKKTFEERIDWFNSNIEDLEKLAEGDKWKERPLYLKAVQTIRKAQKGASTGHMVGLDATCSGMQIMSVMTGCKPGAKATGLINPNARADAYTECMSVVNNFITTNVIVSRSEIKEAVMTHLYGSKAEPEKLFGKDTEELAAFHKAMRIMAPGASEMLEALIHSWKPYELAHEWVLPDGYEVFIPVMQVQEDRIEVDELGSSFTYQWSENLGVKKGVKNAANCVHSVDAYLLRTVIRRCNYDVNWANNCNRAIQSLLIERLYNKSGPVSKDGLDLSETALSLIDRYNACLLADTILLDHLEVDQLACLTSAHLRKLSGTIQSMLDHKPFPVVTVHDDFRAHPNNLNHLRKHYREVLADIADSELLSDLLSQLYGQPVTVTKKSQDLSKYILNSNYAIC